MRLSVENWRIRNIGYPVLFPSSHGLSLTPCSPIFPSKLLEVKTWMGAAAVWGREASAEPFVPATLVVVLPGLELASFPLHPCLLKYLLKAQTHCPGEASLCGPPPRPPHFRFPGNLTVGKTHVAPSTSCPSWLLLFLVCVSCLSNHTGALGAHLRNRVASFCLPPSSQHRSMYTVRVPGALAHGLHDSIVQKAFWVEELLLI